MVPSGPPTPIGSAHSVPSSHLRSNSGMLGAQGGQVSSQMGFPSLVSPRNNQYNNNMNMLGNMPNVTSLLNHSFGNGIPNPGLSGQGNSQRGSMDAGAESDPLSNVGNGLNFTSPSSSFVPSNMVNPGSSSQVQGHQFPDQQQSQQLEHQNFQHNQQSLQQFSSSHNNHQQQQQPQFQLNRSGLDGGGAVKLEPQVTNDQHGQQQQLQPLRNIGQVKMEQQIQNTRSLAPVKVEQQHSEQSLYLQQQQHQQHQHQQQQLLQISRQSPQAAAQINLFHQQRLFQLQQQQQQQQQHQLMKAMPQQRAQLQQQFVPQTLPGRSPVKSVYEPGMCARRLTLYMYQQQHRPKDNNIEFWRKFVAEFFAPHAKKKWCVSMYGSGRQTTGVFPQDVWHCEICNHKPGRGFEATVEVLPRLFKIKYDSGTLEELLYVDMPHEYQNPSGQIVLDYAKAIQESVFEQLRVVRDGQLRIVFSPSPDLKICSWEFCARRHDELIPRRLLIPQVSQLGGAAQKYQAATQNASNLSVPELQNNCNMFVASARQLAKALEVPLVNDLGYTKRYVRCLQISEVVNSMKDLIDYSRETKAGPMESLAKFPRRTRGLSEFNGQPQQSDHQQQQPMANNTNNDLASVQATGATHLASSNGVPSVNNPHNSTITSSSGNTIVGLFHQNSMNSRQQNSMSNANSPYGGSTVQIPSPGSHAINHSPFQSPTPSSSNNNPPQPTHMSAANSPATMNSGEADPSESQSSVQKIINEMMMSSQMANDVKNINRVSTTNNNMGFNGGIVGSGSSVNNGSGIMGSGFGNMANNSMINGLRGTMGNNNSMSMNGRMGMGSMVREQSMNHQQPDLGNQMLSGLGAINGFNNLQFD